MDPTSRPAPHQVPAGPCWAQAVAQIHAELDQWLHHNMALFERALEFEEFEAELAAIGRIAVLSANQRLAKLGESSVEIATRIPAIQSDTGEAAESAHSSEPEYAAAGNGHAHVPAWHDETGCGHGE